MAVIGGIPDEAGAGLLRVGMVRRVWKVVVNRVGVGRLR